jgi:rRNA maturation protein Nop10
MTRNSKKFQKQTNQEQQPQQDTKESILSKLSFIASTEMVKLPTKGLYYPKSSPLYGVEEVELKHMTAKEEDILSSLTSENSKDKFIRIVQGILVSPDVDASLFCEQDMAAILLNARKTGFGNSFTVSELCLGCGEITGFEFDLSKQEVIHPNKEKVAYNSDEDTITISLPVAELDVTIRILSVQELETLEQEKKKKEELGLEYNRTTSFFRACIKAVEGIEDKQLVDKLIENMPAVDALCIKEYYLDFRPKLSTLQEVECQSCGAVNRKEVPASWAFFRPDESIRRESNV